MVMAMAMAMAMVVLSSRVKVMAIVSGMEMGMVALLAEGCCGRDGDAEEDVGVAMVVMVMAMGLEHD